MWGRGLGSERVTSRRVPGFVFCGVRALPWQYVVVLDEVWGSAPSVSTSASVLVPLRGPVLAGRRSDPNPQRSSRPSRLCVHRVLRVCREVGPRVGPRAPEVRLCVHTWLVRVGSVTVCGDGRGARRWRPGGPELGPGRCSGSAYEFSICRGSSSWRPAISAPGRHPATASPISGLSLTAYYRQNGCGPRGSCRWASDGGYRPAATARGATFRSTRPRRGTRGSGTRGARDGPRGAGAARRAAGSLVALASPVRAPSSTAALPSVCRLTRLSTARALAEPAHGFELSLVSASPRVCGGGGASRLGPRPPARSAASGGESAAPRASPRPAPPVATEGLGDTEIGRERRRGPQRRGRRPRSLAPEGLRRYSIGGRGGWKGVAGPAGRVLPSVLPLTPCL